MNQRQNKIYQESKNLTDLKLCEKYVAFVSSVSQETIHKGKGYSQAEKDEGLVLMKLLEERKISTTEAIKIVHDPTISRKKGKEVLNKMAYDGMKNISIGGILLLLGIGLSNSTPFLFYGAILIGGILFLIGVGNLASYLYFKFEYRNQK